MVRHAWILAAAGTLLLLIVYGFDVGHGFVKDDFVWILTSRIDAAADLRGLMGSPMGFFRPIVSLSFAVNHALFGDGPIGYGVTNLALLLACTAALALLLRAVGLGRGVAVGAAFLWALNFQGINMAVLWISGRTALLVTLFAVAAACAWVRGYRLTATFIAMAAMWSKEEGFVLPAILTAWSAIDARGRGDLWAVGRSWPLWLAAAVSFMVRALSGAFTPSSAPTNYQYQLDVMTLADNAAAYADRIATTPILALLVFWLAAGAPSLRPSASEGLLRPKSDVVFKGAIWVALAMLPTVLLPVRSSLYAVLPSAGLALIVGSLAQTVAIRAAPQAVRRAVVALILVFAGLVPVYRIRNGRYVNEAELSRSIVAELASISVQNPDGGMVVIKDVRDVRPTAEQALGPLADRAADLATGGRIQAWIDPPPAELAGMKPPDRRIVATLIVEGGSVRRGP